MKNTFAVGFIMLGIGIAIGWVAKPAAPVEKPVTAAAPRSGGKPSENPTAVLGIPEEFTVPPGKRALREPSVKKPSDTLSPEDKEQIEKMQGEMTKAMIGRQRTKFEQHLQRLGDSLQLTETQKASMNAWLGERMKSLENLDFNNPESMAGLTDLTKGISTMAIEDQLEASLTADQKTALTAFQEKEHQSKVDSAALKSLSQLQGIIGFEEGQRDEVYKILTAAAEEKILKDQENPDPTSMFTEGMGIEMDPYGLGLQQAMVQSSATFANPGDGSDKKSIAQSMREIIDQRINDKVEKLRPVLNDKQLEQYRAELKAKGPGMFGNALMHMENSDSTSSSIVIPAK